MCSWRTVEHGVRPNEARDEAVDVGRIIVECNGCAEGAARAYCGKERVRAHSPRADRDPVFVEEGSHVVGMTPFYLERNESDARAPASAPNDAHERQSFEALSQIPHEGLLPRNRAPRARRDEEVDRGRKSRDSF